jgi:hypothetical protein
MRVLGQRLAAAGYQVEIVDYPSREHSIEVLAEVAVGGVLRKLETESVSKVHFVTHSLGGILVRVYFAEHPMGTLGRVVMLGPPNGGSEVVDRLKGWRLFRAINGPAGSQLGTGTDSVPIRLGPAEFELGVMAGDRSINWINSAMIRGPDDGKVSVERTRVAGMKAHVVVHTTHPMMMRNPEVIGQVLHFLVHGAFQR